MCTWMVAEWDCGVQGNVPTADELLIFLKGMNFYNPGIPNIVEHHGTSKVPVLKGYQTLMVEPRKCKVKKTSLLFSMFQDHHSRSKRHDCLAMLARPRVFADSWDTWQ